ncbi:MAG: HPF/RaiA family ribosome-associated protein [Desulfobacteraceae bacterium]|nr:HPF/RaiA family ribosome-associated protein [Desulfobacteraceae bacterium]
MEVPLEISYRGVDKSDFIDEIVRRQVAKLEKMCTYMVSCRVVIEKRQMFQRVGNPYRVRIDVRVPPGHELVATRDSTEGDLHDRLPTTIRSGFDAMRRQLQELMEKQRGEVKAHPLEQEATALVTRLFPVEGYGFLTTPDGRELYFHRNAVLNNDFDRLELGTGVRFAEEMGEEGLQASTVQIIDKPGVRAASEAEEEYSPG